VQGKITEADIPTIRLGATVSCLERGANDLRMATPSSLAPVKYRMVYVSGAGLPRLSWKTGR